jgi:hypothetical protein
VPWAACCIGCQEQIDRGEIDIDAPIGELLAPAA